MNLFFKLYLSFRKKWYRFQVKVYKKEIMSMLPKRLLFGNNVSFTHDLRFDFDQSNSTINIGDGALFRGHAFLLAQNDGKLEIGDGCFFNNYFSVNCLNKVSIGDNVIVGESVKIYDHNHKFRSKEIPFKDQGFKTGEISIGNNCWIGSNVIILKGAEIGNNCVIGANCIIDFKVPDGSLIKIDNSNSSYSITQIG